MPDVARSDELSRILARSVQGRSLSTQTADSGAMLLRESHRHGRGHGHASAAAETTQRITSLETAVQDHAIEHDVRLSNLERRQSVTEKQTAANALDLKWSHAFEKQIASYEEAVHIVTDAIDTATTNFQGAQQAQAQAEAMAVQVIGLLAGVAFAGGFGWVFSKALGGLKLDAELVEWTVKKFEGAVNTAVSMAPNVAGVYVSNENTAKGATPAVNVGRSKKVSSAGKFMNKNLAQLAGHRGRIAGAFEAREVAFAKFTPSDWLALDLAAQEASYKERFDALTKSNAGADLLKPLEELGDVIERGMWAVWIVNQDAADRERQVYVRSYGDNRSYEELKSGPADLHLGGYVEDELNRLGIDTFAHVKLSGHALWPNSPYDWGSRLLNWAKKYDEGVNKT